VEHAAQGGDLIAASPGCGERRAGVRQERLAGGGEPDQASVAKEKRLPELALKATDLRADAARVNCPSSATATK
jgi:hypothetical protein